MNQLSRPATRFGGKRAVVIGGSMAGLAAARVLSDHFEEVIVVERDSIADELLTARKGVPQGRHSHLLLARGEKLLAGMFPDLLPNLIREGAVVLDFGRDLAWFSYGYWMVRAEHSVAMTCMTRPLLESHVRRRVFAIPGVRRLDGHEVIALRTTPDRQRLLGVTLRRLGGSDPAEELDTDVVVEASGRGSRLPAWLEGLGLSKAPETTVKINLGYGTRHYRPPPGFTAPWKALYIQDAVPGRRQGVIVPVEGGKWTVSLSGVLGEHPPRDNEGYLAFAKSLQHDLLYRVLRESEPVSDIETFMFPAHLRRHYERAPHLPEGLLVLGDAFTSLNPIFGQGMTAALLNAEALAKCLSEQVRRKGPGVLSGLTRRYHSAAAKSTLEPWLIATGEDFRFPEVEGQRPLIYNMTRWFTNQVLRASRTDPQVYVRFMRIMHMLEPLQALMRPSVMWSMLHAPEGQSSGEPFGLPDGASGVPDLKKAG